MMKERNHPLIEILEEGQRITILTNEEDLQLNIRKSSKGFFTVFASKKGGEKINFRFPVGRFYLGFRKVHEISFLAMSRIFRNRFFEIEGEDLEQYLFSLCFERMGLI